MEMDFEGVKTARLCHVRKKSIEVPLENLLSGVVFLSGGRDKRGGPVLSLVHPTDPDVDVEALMEMQEDDFIDMISYFTFVPSEEVRSKKFSVALATDGFHDFLLRASIKALTSFHQSNPEIIHMVYFIGSSRNTSADLVEWAYNADCKTDEPAVKPPTDIPHTVVPTMPELYQYISADELTHEFGGTLQYKHQDWVRFRMQVEPFICDVVSVSKRLAQAVAPFSEDYLPQTLTDAEESLKVHHLERRKTLETLHVDELTSEGERIRKKMNSPSQQQFRNNPDFVATLDTIEVLMSRVENVRTRLEDLWDSRHAKLQANFKHKKFETEAHQVIDWFEQYAEEFFETHNDIGDSKQVVMAMVTELDEFESSTKQILTKTSRLLKKARELEDGEEEDDEFLTGLTSKIKDLTKDFTTRLNSRKKKLNNNLKLHEIMNRAIDWCIEGVSFLADFDLMSQNLEDINPTEWKTKLLEFQELCPPPTRDEIALLNEMVASPESVKGKEGFQFALNRILELHERFELYHRMLDEMIEEKQGGPSPELVDESVFPPEDVPDLAGTPPTGLEAPTGDGRLSRRRTIGLVDIDGEAMQALNILDKTARAADPQDDAECLSLVDFLSELGDSESEGFRSRTESKVSLSGEHSKFDKAGISAPINPKFVDEAETISLDDTKIEEPEDMAAQTAIAKHRRLLMEELLETEQIYIRDLEHLCAHYMPSMDNVSALPKCLVGKKHVLFGYLTAILEFNRDTILPQLRKCSKAPIKMGLVFLEHEEEFYEYAKYFKNKPAQDHLLGTEEAIHFFRTIQESVDDSLPLLAHLIKPVQRVIKYKQFLEEMIKYSSKGKEQLGVQKGAKKEYFDKLKEALKMVDFVLRHGNDLLALESLKGYEGSLAEQGRVLRVGVLTVIDGFSKHKRKAFLFEHCLILAKIKRTTKSGLSGTDEYEFRNFYRTNALVLRENIPGHSTRFALEMKKITLELQAESMEAKMEWVTEIWDLFFSHMLKLRDDNLESYGTKAISNLINSGTATLTRGRALGHSSRKMRLSTMSDTRRNREAKANHGRPISTASISSIGSAGSLQEFAMLMKQSKDRDRKVYSPTPFSPITRASHLSGNMSASSSANSISSSVPNGDVDPEETLHATSHSLQMSSSSSSFLESDKPMFNTPL